MDSGYILYINNILQLATALIATIHLKKYRFSKEKYFFHFLWFTFLVEVFGAILSDALITDNHWLYNVYMVISFLYYYYWYYSILQRKIHKRVVLVFGVVFGGFALSNLMIQSRLEYHQYTFIIGALFTLVATVFHFWQLLYGDEILNIKHKLAFWISTGLLLFNMGMIPLMLLSDYLELTGIRYYSLIISLNFILYGCYIIGFLWAKEKYNRF